MTNSKRGPTADSIRIVDLPLEVVTERLSRISAPSAVRVVGELWSLRFEGPAQIGGRPVDIDVEATRMSAWRTEILFRVGGHSADHVAAAVCAGLVLRAPAIEEKTSKAVMRALLA